MAHLFAWLQGNVASVQRHACADIWLTAPLQCGGHGLPALSAGGQLYKPEWGQVEPGPQVVGDCRYSNDDELCEHTGEPSLSEYDSAA